MANYEAKINEARLRQQLEIHRVYQDQSYQRLAKREKKYRKIFEKNNALQKKMNELEELLKQDRHTEETSLKEVQENEQKELQAQIQKENEERAVMAQQVLAMFKQRHRRQVLRLQNEHKTLEITTKFLFEKLLYLALDKGASDIFKEYKTLDDICEQEAVELRNIQDEFLKVEKLKVEEKSVQAALKAIQGEGFGVKVDLSVTSSLLPQIKVL